MKSLIAFSTGLLFVAISILSSTKVEPVEAQASTSDSANDGVANQSFWRRLLDTGMQAHKQSQTYSSLISNEDPRATRMLRESINQATDLINSYERNGLPNMPNLPNVPGLGMLLHLPDKLLRAELSMLQDEIRMAKEMIQSPMTATMNLPRDLSMMLSRMAEQMEQ